MPVSRRSFLRQQGFLFADDSLDEGSHSSTIPVQKTSKKPQHDARHTRKTVSFSTVQVRSYQVIMGDHPCCSEGCPLSLGWDYQESAEVDSVNDFEARRQSERKTQFKTSYEERHRRLVQDAGCSEHTIRHVNRQQQRHCRNRRAQRAEQCMFFQQEEA